MVKFMLLARRLSWFLYSPNEECAKHYQMAYDDNDVDDLTIISNLMIRAKEDGIRTPPTEILMVRMPI